MPDTATTLLLVFLLLLLAGLLGLGEVAVISASKKQLRKLADEGNARAHAVLQLGASSQRFLAAMLVGVTLLTLLAGFFAGAGLATPLHEWLVQFTWMPAWVSQPAVFAATMLGTTLVSLVISDFLPQRLAILAPERVALGMVRFLRLTCWILGPVANFAAGPLDAVLSGIGLKPGPEKRVSEEDIKTIVERGLRAGSIQKAEKEMVEGVLNLDALPVTAIMTPRPKIVWLNLDDAEEVNWRKIVASGHSHFPVYQGSYDQVLGMVAVKALWANDAIGVHTPLKDLLTPALLVPTKLAAIAVLEQFKKSGKHTALVVDEFGSVHGLVTLIDVLEAIVGDLPDPGTKTAAQARQREDGSWLIDATLPVSELKAMFQLEELPDQTADYRTLGGLMVTRLGRIPQAGDYFDWCGHRFEVVDMDRNRVDKVLVARRADLNGRATDAADVTDAERKVS